MSLDSVAVDVEVDRSSPERVVFKETLSLEGDLSAEEKKKIYTAAGRCPVKNTLGRPLTFELKVL